MDGSLRLLCWPLHSSLRTMEIAKRRLLNRAVPQGRGFLCAIEHELAAHAEPVDDTLANLGHLPTIRSRFPDEPRTSAPICLLGRVIN